MSYSNTVRSSDRTIRVYRVSVPECTHPEVRESLQNLGNTADGEHARDIHNASHPHDPVIHKSDGQRIVDHIADNAPTVEVQYDIDDNAFDLGPDATELTAEERDYQEQVSAVTKKLIDGDEEVPVDLTR